ICGPERFTDELSVMDVTRRLRSVEALGSMGGRTAVDALIRALTDPEPDVRARAADLLGDLGDPSARDELERAEFDPVPDVASASSPHSSTSPSTGDSSAWSGFAATVWNPATRRTSGARIALACSAAEPCHGLRTCHARPPTAVASGVVVSTTIRPAGICSLI